MDQVNDNSGLEPGKEIEYAGFWIRVGAALLDGIVLLPLVGLEFYNKISIHSISLLIIGTFLTMLYKPYLEYTYGATLGKQLLEIRVVSEDYGPLSINQAILRYMPWFISAFFGLLLGIEYYRGDEYADSFLEIGLITQGSYWNEINSLYALVFILIVMVVAFDAKKQGLHDKIASTYCIKN